MNLNQVIPKIVHVSLASFICGAGILTLNTLAWGQEPDRPAPMTAVIKPAHVGESLQETPSATPSEAPASPAPSRIRRPQLASRHGLMLNRITRTAASMQGVPYVFGGTSARGFDCSGFTQRMFSLAGIKLRRMADEQYAQGKPVSPPQPGDLVFFSTYLPGPSHVGIYLGEGAFIHASCSHGVTISNLSESYYKRTYIGARRFF